MKNRIMLIKVSNTCFNLLKDYEVVTAYTPKRYEAPAAFVARVNKEFDRYVKNLKEHRQAIRACLVRQEIV